MSPGAGVGGVATAARLAKAGFRVTVFEKNNFTGGRCSLIHYDGYVSRALRMRYCLADSIVSALIKALRCYSCHSSSGKRSLILGHRSKLRGWSL